MPDTAPPAFKVRLLLLLGCPGCAPCLFNLCVFAAVQGFVESCLSFSHTARPTFAGAVGSLESMLVAS